MRAALFLVLLASTLAPTRAQQISIPRVESMPALPADYQLRDWDRVAAGYDSLVFDVTRTGTYFPLARTYAGTVNYPGQGGFGIESYVGSGNEIPGEAINGLPALVGATWAGANKRTQFGTDWVLRSEEWFNRRPEENVYLNGPQSTSGSDWWYDTMPNVFFYQLRAQYPGVAHSNEQFGLVADQWLRAVGALGGRTMPWAIPNVNYRAIALSTMTPLTSGSAPEPEAAGAIAWILYSAYRETGQERYRIGAEQALEALDAQVNNPSYELQLPYGTLAAARMNAEVGASFDVGKMLRWSFDRGPIRGWGTISGISRGGYTLDGLVGEVDGNGYAFALNGFQQAAALVPVARYDDRYARAIGRWMVNLASASRLFYSTELPAANQDGEAWAYPNDPRGLVAYEALRGTFQGTSPYATGDNFAPTNFGLYGSSSVGYLAAVVDSTEVPGVLWLDLRRTDVYRPPSYPSFLVYNPTATEQTVTAPRALPIGQYDVYDAASNAFIGRGVSGRPAVTIPPDAARVLVFPTAGGAETSVDGRRMVNGIVIDYRDGTGGNLPPRVRALVASDTTLARNQTATLHCTPDDAETAQPTVEWTASRGTLVPDGRTATWASPDVGDADVTCRASDGSRTGAAMVRLRVVVNQAPTGVTVGATPPSVDPGQTTVLTCSATDPDADALSYTWSVTAGAVSGPGASTTFTAPGAPGTVTATCTATDPAGASATGTALVVVGRLVLDLALDGSADDATVFDHDGVVSGPQPAPGRDGLPGHALAFDGVDDVVTVEATPALTPTARVSVSVWLNPSSLPSREMFAVSHGSWQNRWKVSLTPEGRPRWTVNTTARIVDLDAPAPVAAGTFTHVVGTYDGARMRLYVNGVLAGDVAQNGPVRTTALPLLLGQMLPSDNGYNFPGTLDDVRVYNVALTAEEVAGIYQTAGESGPGGALGLGQPFPNPARGRVTVPLTLGREATVAVTVVDALGRTVATLHDGPLPAGAHTLQWDAARTLASGVYVVRLDGDAGAASRRVLLVR